MSEEQTVIVIPCSGIGKVHGLISREATYLVTDELAPGETETLCLALLVMGDSEAVAQVQQCQCITIDGCPKACAQKNVEIAGGTVVKAMRVVDTLKTHRGVQPGSASGLTNDGWTIAREIADDVAAEVARLRTGRDEVLP